MLDLLWSVGGFLVAIGVLVSFHEFGHYWVARRCGVKVLRFSIGFGKVLWSRRAADGVEWSLSAVPLGGYVKMLDEREGPVPAAERHLAFNNASVGRRFAIVAAGPLFNFALAIAFYWLVFIVGVQGMKPVLAEPPANTAAARAGLHAGDWITALDGEPTSTWSALRTELIDRALDGATLSLQVQDRAGAARTVLLSLEGTRVEPEQLFDDLGLQAYQPAIPARLEEVVAGGAAAAAGLQQGDLLLTRNGEPVGSWQDWAAWVRAHPGEVVKLRVERAGAPLEVQLIVGSQTQGEQTVGRMGARVAVPEELWHDLRAEMRLDPLSAVPAAITHAAQMSALTLKMLARMVIGQISIKNVSGPIQIAQVAGYSAQIGLVSFLSFMAIVSVSLGVLNLLPVPLLDGGHLLFYAVEAVKGSPLSERVQEAGQRIGLTFLVLLMGLAFYNDIMRLIQ